MNEIIGKNIQCSHCGLEVKSQEFKINEKYFCCIGCKNVYEILENSGLNDYYDIENEISKRKKIDSQSKGKYDFLNNPIILESIVNYKIDNKVNVKIDLPDIHCSACIYLLENLFKINYNILDSKVNFLKKTCTITYNSTDFSLTDLAVLLDSIGYPPNFTLADANNQKKRKRNPLYFRLAVAGFAFGNIMLFSLPEYLSDNNLESDFSLFLSWVSLILSPLIIYAGWGYLISAYKGIKSKIINIDVPISLGIIVLLLRSIYDIVFDLGPGYIDSLSGLIFFLLLGKVFQDKTYHRLSFDKDLDSFFPLSVLNIDETEKYIPITEIKKESHLVLLNNELIPIESILLSENAKIDYSFLTGESVPVVVNKGEKLWTGGKSLSGRIEIKANSDFNKNLFENIWQKQKKENEEFTYSNLSNSISKYFTFVILIIAISSFVFWIALDPQKAFDSFTAVLIIACPCASALTIPFAYGTALRLFGKVGFFLKDSLVVEKLANVNHLVFDKTGTLTTNKSEEISFEANLDEDELLLVKSICSNSNHPLSKIIAKNIDGNILKTINFNEIPSYGIEGQILDKFIKIGSAKFIDSPAIEKKIYQSIVHIEINNIYKGYILINKSFRKNIEKLFDKLNNYKVSLISGDNENDKSIIENILPKNAEILFNYLPDDKLKYIVEKKKSSNLAMIGDGLNDSLALKESNVGIAITEDSNSFTPASDCILLGENLIYLDKIMKFSKNTKSTVIMAYLFAFLINIFGLSYAVTGNLSPVFAAIYMPASSISIVILIVTLENLLFYRLFKGISNDSAVL